MPSLERTELPSINPVIIAFDDTNDLLDYVFDQTIGVTLPERSIIQHDILDTFYQACRIVKKERRLTSFVRTCGRICVDAEIDYEDPAYAKAQEFAIVDEPTPESNSELDMVIRHFAPHVSAFEALYGTVLTPAKKPKQTELTLPLAKLPPDCTFIERKSLVPILKNDQVPIAIKALIRMGIQKSGARFEEFKNNASVKKAYRSSGTEQFKKDFPNLRDEIVALLQDNGIDATWIITGRARGTRYVLAQVTEAASNNLDAQTPAAAPIEQAIEDKREPSFNAQTVKDAVPQTGQAPAAATNPEEALRAAELQEVQRLERAAERMAQLYERSAMEFVSQQPGGRIVARDVMIYLESTFGITRVQARDVLNSALQNGGLHSAGTEDGRKAVAANPVETIKNRGNQGPVVAEKVVEEILSPEELILARQICDYLIAQIHQNKGSMVKTMASGLEVDESQLRRPLNHLVGKGVLKRDKRWLRSRSPHSKKNEVLYYVFADQDTWDSYKGNPSEVLSVLEAADLVDVP